ncbi:hypothetical protein FOL47_009693 [Perkinsus chesapeaki]|uniref:WD repeat domain 19 n=1 Tax=Perkinsus chesapeaki TaxID=330153 RepID=A0A7J6L6W5_PERCH|nr:hypothetical protein FOL47_009693 [Perkinsus chesapeaki]
MVLRELFSLREECFGSGLVDFHWDPSGTRLAAIAASRPASICIFDSSGDIKRDVSLENRRAPVLSFQWDNTGNLLALIQKGLSVVSVYHYEEGKLDTLDCSSNEPTFIAWNRIGSQLAIGMAKGNLMIYNSRNKKLQLIAGKHGRKITCGAWTTQGLLVIGSDDRIISLSNAEGETLRQVVVKSSPVTVRVGDEVMTDHKGSLERGILSTKACVGTGKDTLTFIELEDMSVLKAIKFEHRYGAIVEYGWFGDEHLCTAFTSVLIATITFAIEGGTTAGGQIIVTAGSGETIGQEIFRCQPFSSVDALALSSVPAKAGGYSSLRAAVAAEGMVKMIDLREFREMTEECVRFDNADASGIVSHIIFGRQGQTLTFNISTGCIRCYVARLPLMFQSRCGKLAWLSSLREATIVEIGAVESTARNENSSDGTRINLQVEPTILGVGPECLAAGNGKEVFFYTRSNKLLGKQEYPAKVDGIELSTSYSAVLAGGKLYVHSLKNSGLIAILPTETNPQETKVQILSMKLTSQDILVYSTSEKELIHYSVSDRCSINEYRHSEAIVDVYPNGFGGTYTAFVDTKGELYLYNAVTEVSLKPVEGCRVGKLKGVLWDLADPNIFVVIADARGAEQLDLHTFVIYNYSLSGERVIPIGGTVRRSKVSNELIDLQYGTQEPTALSHGEIPIAIENGRVVLQSRVPGELRSLELASHSGIKSGIRRLNGLKDSEIDVDEMGNLLMRFAALGKLDSAYRICLTIPEKPSDDNDESMQHGRDSFMRLIARHAVELLETDMAIMAYRECGDADMVTFLERFVKVEDVAMLQAYMRLLLGHKQEHTAGRTARRNRLSLSHKLGGLNTVFILVVVDLLLAAIESFVKAGAPKEALEVMCDSQMWDAAKGLAPTVDPQRLPSIHRQLAMTLEDRGSFKEALLYYKEALGGRQYRDEDTDLDETEEEHIQACNAGLARCLCECGKFEAATDLCLELSEEDVILECATSMERMKQYSLAGRLHQHLGNLERACSLFIKDMDFEAARPLMEEISTPKLHLSYGKGKEARGFYKDAVASYEKAGDFEAIVRLLVTEHQLNDPRRAMEMVRNGTATSTKAAEIVADYCQRDSDIPGSIEFLTRAHLDDMAFEIAVRHDRMDVYEGTLKQSEESEELAKDQFRCVAGYYKERNMPLEAARNYVHCGEYEIALELCLSLEKTGSNSEGAALSDNGALGSLPAHMDLAIDIAGRSQDEGIINRLVDFLLNFNTGLGEDELDYQQAASNNFIVLSIRQNMCMLTAAILRLPT